MLRTKTHENMDQVKELGFKDRIFTICVVANILGISFGSEYGACGSC
jgi:hypothetical protein